jgi:hypothetical protein
VVRRAVDTSSEHLNEVLRPGDHVFIHGLTNRAYYNTRQAVIHSVDARWSRARLVLKDAFLDLTTATILVHVYNIRPMSEWILLCEADGTYTTHNHAWGENRRAAVPQGATTGTDVPGKERAPYEEPWGNHFTNRTLEFLWNSYQTATPGPVRPTPVMIGPRQNPLCYLPHVCGDDNCEYAGTLHDVRTHEREAHNQTNDRHARAMEEVRSWDVPVQRANQQTSDGARVPLIAEHQVCKGRGSFHASSHGISAGGTRQPGRVDRRSRGLVHRKTNRQGFLLLVRAIAYVAPSYSIGCVAAEEHSWGAGDRQRARGTLSGTRERESLRTRRALSGSS